MAYLSPRIRNVIIFILYPFIASAVSFWLSLNSFESVIVFLVLPSVYLSFLLPHSIVKSGLFSLTVSTLLFIPIDYVAHLTGTWLVPDTVFSFRLFNLVPWEDILWAFFLAYFMIMFYEYFLDTHRDRKIWRVRMKYLLGVASVFFVLFIFLFFVYPSALHLPFFYLWVGLIFFLLPVVVELFRRPKLSGKIFIVAGYFFLVALVYEITALKLGWWSFPGPDFIGWVEIVGARFPFEEFFFWLVLTAAAAISLYEFYDDDEK